MWYWYHTHYPVVFLMVAASDSPVGPFKVMGAREVGSQTGTVRMEYREERNPLVELNFERNKEKQEGE